MTLAHKTGKFLIACGLIASLASCAAITGRETPGQYIDDVAITTSVKTKILAEPMLKVMQINVETMQGVVQLSGFVDSRLHANKAVELAGGVGGVVSVKDNLIVRP